MERHVTRARALVGSRFRPQGRTPADGLDCVGVAVAAFGLPSRQVPHDYRMRGGAREQAEQEIAAHFIRLATASARSGDLLLVEAGPAQLHVIILTPAGYIHADAALRRVVEVPGSVPWPVLSAWRHPSTQREGT